MSDLHAVLTASGLAHTGPGILTGLVLSIDGSTAVTLTAYDNTAASGTIIFQAHISPESAEQPFSVFFSDRYAPRFATGLYLAMSAAGMSVNYWAVGK